MISAAGGAIRFVKNQKNRCLSAIKVYLLNTYPAGYVTRILNITLKEHIIRELVIHLAHSPLVASYHFPKKKSG
jgi:hypothetical protein